MFKTFDEMPLLLTVPEAAESLRISTNHLYYVIRSDKSFPIITLGRRILIPRDDLQEWINNSKFRK